MQEVDKALQALRGEVKISAATLVSKLGEISHFDTPQQLTSYRGTVSGEDSSGERMRRGASPRPVIPICDVR
jgi:transposase